MSLIASPEEVRSICLLMTLRFIELLPAMTITQYYRLLFICQTPHLKSKEVLLFVYFTEANPLNTATLFDSRALTACSSLTTDLMWSTHIANICTKTRKLIGILYRRFYKYSSCTTLLKLYISFIRPHAEYAAAAWDPFLRKDIDLIEDVQKYGLKVCLKSWSANYSELLERSHLPTLQARRREAKLCHLYKIVNKETFFPDAPTLSRTLSYPSCSVHSKALVPIYMLIRHNSCTPSSQVPPYLHGTRYP